ncbi:MAG: TRAP transporter small permease subunit [Chloroflexota bacterium]|nr:TRAP transporter small permease subunit [Chloroflexota bacterium]
MQGLLRIVHIIDPFTAWTGRIFAVLVIPLTLGLVYEVFARYVFHAPTIWAYDVTYMLYGALFMLGAAYALYQGAHIRTDIFYRSWSPRTQGRVDAAMYILFYFPGILFFLLAGWDYASHSYALNEQAAVSPWRPYIWPLKMVLPLTGLLLLIQGLSELLKSIYAAVTGAWPPEHHETEVNV